MAGVPPGFGLFPCLRLLLYPLVKPISVGIEETIMLHSLTAPLYVLLHGDKDCTIGPGLKLHLGNLSAGQHYYVDD